MKRYIKAKLFTTERVVRCWGPSSLLIAGQDLLEQITSSSQLT